MVWAERAWWHTGGITIPVRANVAGAFEGLPVVHAPPGGGVRSDATLSVVVRDPGWGAQRLPALFVGTSCVHADLDPGAVNRRLRRAVAAIADSVRLPVYSLHGCVLEGRVGLYGRDVFNRSPFRFKLLREGMRFSDDPYVRVTSDGMFHNDDWGEFLPSFVIAGAARDSAGITQVLPGLGSFALLAHRLGTPAPAELRCLSLTLAHAPVVNAHSAARLADWIRGHRPHAA